MSDEEVRFVLRAVQMVTEHGWKLLPQVINLLVVKIKKKKEIKKILMQILILQALQSLHPKNPRQEVTVIVIVLEAELF